MRSIAWWPVLTVTIIAAAWDLRTRRIPNWLVMPFMAAGPVVASCTHGWRGLGQSMGGWLLGACAYGVLCWMGGMGMGDVKLAAAIGAWIGPSQCLAALVLTGLAGGAIAAGWALTGGFGQQMLANLRNLLSHVGRRGFHPHPELVLTNARTRKLPYAPAMTVGTLLSFWAH